MRTDRLKPAELERLALLSEELGEAVKAIGKILRHGYNQHNPKDEVPITNREQLERELGDVLFSIELLTSEGDVEADHIDRHRYRKLASAPEYLYCQARALIRYRQRWPYAAEQADLIANQELS